MFDIGWTEMAIVLLVALIIIGPKDLPRLARTIGQWSGKARALAREFHSAMDEMAREAELEDIKAKVEKVGSTVTSKHKLKSAVTQAVRDAVDKDGVIEETMKIDSMVDKEQITAKSISPPAKPAPISAPEEQKGDQNGAKQSG